MGLPENRRRHAAGRPDPGNSRPTNRRCRAFEALPPIRVLFDNGAGTSPAGADDGRQPLPRVRTVVLGVPDPGHEGPLLVLRGRAAHSTTNRRAAEGVDSYTSDASATPLTDYSGSTGHGRAVGQRVAVGMELDAAAGRASPCPTCRRRSRATRPRSAAGAVHLWVKSSTPDVDLQATVSEVRPGRQRDVRAERLDPGQRAQARHDRERTSSSRSRRCSSRSRRCSHPTCEPMPAGEFVPVAIPLYFQGHAYRAGSRIRVTIVGAERRRSRSGRSPTRSRQAARRTSRSRSRRACPRA